MMVVYTYPSNTNCHYRGKGSEAGCSSGFKIGAGSCRWGLPYVAPPAAYSRGSMWSVPIRFRLPV